MFLRWPAAIVFTLVVAYILFHLFVWLFNSRYLTGVINKVAKPTAETPEDIRDQVAQNREMVDDIKARAIEQRRKLQDDVKSLEDL